MQKIVVFDVGNVLFFTEWERAGKFLEQQLGVPAERTKELFWGRSWNGRALEWFLNLSEGTQEEFYEIAQQELGTRIPEGIFWEMWNKQWVPNRPVLRLVERISLSANPPTLAICSNINAPHWTYLCSQYGIFRYFSVTALSYRVGKMKPDYEMFRAIMKECGDKTTPSVLFVDDREENARAAREFRWRAHLYERDRNEDLERTLRDFLGREF